MSQIEILAGLLAAVVLLVTLARRWSLPYPIALVLGGLALGFVPGLPRVAMPPDLVLLAFLPPLLFAEALTFSWRDLKANRRPIGLLAFGLVLITTLLVAASAQALVPGLSWGAAFALGAIVAPTDAVAAAAIAKRLHLPRRIITILTGESLLNDAVALVLYRLAIAAVVTGQFSAVQAGGQFLLSSVGGVTVGLAAGGIIGWVRGRMRPDPPVENTISLLTPFAAYLPAEAWHVSGVLAVVTTGLYLGRLGPRFVSAPTRLQAGAIWQMIDFLLNGLLFILVGLQIRPIVENVAGHHPLRLLVQAAGISLVVIGTRMAYVFVTTYVPRWAGQRRRTRGPAPSWRAVALISWTGMRGGVSLAAALALPLTVGSGAAFPARDLLIFLTFAVILSTLVGQGLSLPLLIRRLNLRDDGKAKMEEQTARIQAMRAALDRLTVLAEEQDLPDDAVADLRARYTNRMKRFEARTEGGRDEERETRARALRQVRRELVTAERQAVVGLRDDGSISDSVLLQLQRGLDLEEQRLRLDAESEDEG